MPALSTSPPVSLRPFAGPKTTIEEMVRALNSPRGERSVKVRSFTESVVRGLQPKDYLSEILAIRYACAERLRYLNDPISTEWVKDPERIVDEIEAHGNSLVDCDEAALLMATMFAQVGREVEFVTVGFGLPGSYSHVFPRVKEPKTGQWIVTDIVAGTGEAAMLSRVTTFRTWRTS
jgi:hypothetical protein